MECTNPIHLKGNTYACGKCKACRVSYTQMWAIRLLYEFSADYKKGASFITLTYDNEHLPKDYGLDKDELQRFWKRLRINLQRKYHEFAPEIKYYSCGEYGEKEKIYFSPGSKKPHGRPHYHAIVFGLDNYNDEHREILKKTWQNCESWLFDKDRGDKSGMLPITPDRIEYTTGYVQKKLSGDPGREVYGEATPPFSVCSNGMGIDFAMKNKERLVTNGYTMLKGHKVGIPRYFCDKFGLKRSEVLNNIKPKVDDYNEYWKLFCSDMQKKYGLDYSNPDIWISHSTLIERRFRSWVDDMQFEHTKRVFDEYHQYLKLKGVKL